MPTPRWTDDEHFTIGDTEFTSSFTLGSTSSCFFIRKHRPLVEDLVDVLAPFEQPAIVELGIAAGGSTALMTLLTNPRKLVAVELSERPVAGLEQFIDDHGLRDVVRPYYGVDQADRDRLAEILTAEFDAEPIDLVIDDASHRLAPSRVSFEVLFPHLRPGGLYLIEDWNWQQKVLTGPAEHTDRSEEWHTRLGESLEADAALRAMFEAQVTLTMDDPASPNHELVRRRLEQAAEGQVPDGPTMPELFGLSDTLRAYHEEPPLLTLVFELVLARAGASDRGSAAVDEITLGRWWAIVRRGAAPLAPGEFRVRDLYKDVNNLLRPGDGH